MARPSFNRAVEIGGIIATSRDFDELTAERIPFEEIRAAVKLLMDVAVHATELEKAEANARQARKRDGAPWTTHENEKLARHYYEDRLPIDVIARHHLRSAGAIRSRLAKLGIADNR